MDNFSRILQENSAIFQVKKYLHTFPSKTMVMFKYKLQLMVK